VKAPVVQDAHRWVVSALMEVDEDTAGRAVAAKHFKAGQRQRVDALEVYCRVCRREYEAAKDAPCEVGQLLRGGPIDKRRRKVADDD